MAPIPSIEFIEAALSNGFTSPFGLSYSDPDQKWLIRNHLLSLLEDFPSFSPSIDTFFQDDGGSTNLLVARGSLPVPGPAPAVPIAIWLHENYPTVGPMVFVDTAPCSSIHRDHPFVDPTSGRTVTPYLTTWGHPRCSLSDLARNLAKVFSKDHPFFRSTPRPPGTIHPTLVSKTEALDRLSATVHYHIAVLRSRVDEEVEGLLGLQEHLRARAATASGVVHGLKHERAALEGRVRELGEEARRISDWLKGLETGSADDTDIVDGIDVIGDVFGAVDEKSRLILDCLAGERAIEDTIYAMDEAIEREGLSFETYIKLVRALAREQFQYVATRMKLEEISSPHAPLS